MTVLPRESAGSGSYKKIATEYMVWILLYLLGFMLLLSLVVYVIYDSASGQSFRYIGF
jgi:hypothetical protein